MRARVGHRIAAMIAVAGVSVTGLGAWAPNASPGHAAAWEEPCVDVQLVFARGSGQELGGGEYQRFAQQVGERIDAPTTFDVYELGTDELNGYRYPAVPVGIGSWDAATNTGGAAVSSGRGFAYGASVEEGTDELATYLGARGTRCPGAVFVLAGYSQGAQVIGETYVSLPPEWRDRVVFNALFGDPKLHLPEGEGVWPAACRGHGYSEWRRVVPECDTDNGSLGARKPFLPASYTSSTGLWCADHDFVCGSSKFAGDTAGHGTYRAEGGAIDQAVQEMADRLKTALPAKASTFDSSLHLIGVGTTGLDVVFVLDSTGSMSWQIESAKQYAAQMASTIGAARGRVALVEYRDSEDEFVAVTRVGLTTDIDAFRSALDPVSADGGGDTPEALLAALMTAFDTLAWRPGATKAAVVLTDADYHDPDVATGVSLADVAARSLEIDPVNVYPVVDEALTGTYEPLAEATSGQVIANSGDTVAALTTALETVITRPVPLLANGSYTARPGEDVQFDASASYAIESTIASYEWDFDGDSVFDLTTAQPVASHVYPVAFDGQMQVRITDRNGLIASASVPVTIATTPPDDGLPAAPDTVGLNGAGSAGGGSEVTVTWSGDETRVAQWGVTVNGVPVAKAPVSARSLTLTDVRRDVDAEIGVVGLTSDDAVGPARYALLTAVSGPVPVHRFWSPRFDNAHFFTTNEAEAAHIRATDANWVYEGLAFWAYPAEGAACNGRTAVHRFYSQRFQTHFFTASATEKAHIVANDSNWSYENVAYCAVTTPEPNTRALYRFWSPGFGKHHFTIDAGEARQLDANDPSWDAEGVAYYVADAP